MKWFKHFTDGHDSEGLCVVKAELGWGWIGRWYVLLEMVAAKMDDTDRCHLEYTVSEWCRRLECKPNKLATFMLHIENKLHCNVERRENIIKISIPNLLKRKDEYTSNVGRKSRYVSGETHSQIQTQIQKEEFKNPPPTPPLGESPKTGAILKSRKVEVQKLLDTLCETKKAKSQTPIYSKPSMGYDAQEAALDIAEAVHATEQGKARIFAAAETVAILHGVPVLRRIEGNLRESLHTGLVRNPLALALSMLNATTKAQAEPQTPTF